MEQVASIKAILSWAVQEDRISKNVAHDVRQEIPKPVRKREKGFTDAEAAQLISASRAYRPTVDSYGQVKEFPETTAAKRWVPLLCALTGARVTEITQLRGKDLRQLGDTWVARITPEAGTVKTGEYRDVPLHLQIVELGFVDFVRQRGDGPLFYRSSIDDGNLAQARATSGRVSEWANATGFVPKDVAPNHGWRHRFKTVGRDLGCSDRVIDAICGHAGRTAGDNYGDVSITAKKNAIDTIPRFEP